METTDKEKSKYAEKAENEAVSFVQKCEEKQTAENHTINPEKADAFDMKKYLRMCVDAEVNVYYLTRWLAEIFEQSYITDDESLKFDKQKNDELRSLIKQSEKSADSNLQKVKDAYNSDKNRIESVSETDLICPPVKPPVLHEPSKESFEEKKKSVSVPKKPTMPPTNFFNRSTVERNYKEQLLTYEKMLKIYNARLSSIDDEYAAAMEVYRSKLPAYTSEMEKYNGEYKAYKEKLYAYVSKKTKALTDEYNRDVSQIKTESDNAIKEYKTEAENEIRESKHKKNALFLSNEAKIVKEELKKAIELRAEIYSYSVIYPKYRNLIAMSTICEYFESGRCNTLDGPDGAYNLYETELRANEIITQIQKINSSLESIKAGQFLLYTELTSVNSYLKEIDNQLQYIYYEIEELGCTIDDIRNGLGYIANGVDTISYYSAATAYASAVGASASMLSAHYSKMNAQYAKKNAELTDSLGYLVAFKG